MEHESLDPGRATADVTTLRRWLRELEDERDIFKRTLDKRDAEIERLRKSLDDHLESEAAETRRADRERDRARTAEAEIERLRRELRIARRDVTNRQFRMRNAWDQLERYDGEVFNDELVDLLEAITDINDDLWHDRHPDCITESIDKAIAILQMMRPIR